MDTTARVHQDHRPRAERENKLWRNTAVQCCKTHPLPKDIAISYNPILPHFQPHWGPPVTSLQESIHVQLISPCLSNAGGAPVPNSSTALSLPGLWSVDPVPNPWTDFPADSGPACSLQTCLMVPGLCLTLLQSPDPIPTSDLPHHQQLPRGSGLWADPKCYPRAHPAHLA